MAHSHYCWYSEFSLLGLVSKLWSLWGNNALGRVHTWVFCLSPVGRVYCVTSQQWTCPNPFRHLCGQPHWPIFLDYHSSLLQDRPIWSWLYIVCWLYPFHYLSGGSCFILPSSQVAITRAALHSSGWLNTHAHAPFWWQRFRWRCLTQEGTYLAIMDIVSGLGRQPQQLKQVSRIP